MTKTIEVKRTVTVTVDESRFTPQFMASFRHTMFPFDTIEQHIDHIARARATGIVTSNHDFLEGYGKLCDFGIITVVIDTESEVVTPA